jgi:hypothetical protein
MKHSLFKFIKNAILKNNLEILFDHILELLTVLNDKRIFISPSSFKKTIIIHVASIIEALLLHILREKNLQDKVELKEIWEYKNIKLIYKLSKNQEIIWAIRERKKETKKLEKLNFLEINRLCLKQKIISNNIFKKAEQVRELRNELHIGGIDKIKREYSNEDLIFTLNAMNNIINIAFRFLS